MIQTKVICDSNALYAHTYSKKEVELTLAILERWWQIELHPGTVSISQPSVEKQFNLEAKHACCASCARDIVKMWAEEAIAEKTECAQ